ncbi:MAG: hypothetical protein MUC58_11665 [Rhizobiaceae bacterium]|jgi:hypothetical protein|nr:hypothetical protein [Rhizobiaceae bacterium]
MKRYREAADFAVGKAVLFTAFGIVVTMLGTAFDFALSARFGAYLSLMLAGTLLWFASTAERREPERTETFMLLPDEARPVSGAARRVFRTVLHDTYVHYARKAFQASVLLFTAAMLIKASGLQLGLR